MALALRENPLVAAVEVTPQGTSSTLSRVYNVDLALFTMYGVKARS